LLREFLGIDRYGVFELQGKPLNIRNASPSIIRNYIILQKLSQTLGSIFEYNLYNIKRAKIEAGSSQSKLSCRRGTPIWKSTNYC